MCVCEMNSHEMGLFDVTFYSYTSNVYSNHIPVSILLAFFTDCDFKLQCVQIIMNKLRLSM